MKKISLILLLSILICCFSACNNPYINEDKFTVAVSIPPQAEYVEKICGNNAEVITMIPAGASAETYELTAKEIAAFSKADVYFTIGVAAEENGILPHVSKDTKVVNSETAVSQVYPDLKIGHERDPHIWLSPKRAVVIVEKIAEELCAADKENAEIYSKSAKAYIEELEKVDGEIKNLLQSKQGKPFFVFHPAFQYFADDYGLKMYALEKHGAEATAKDLISLAKTAKEMGVKTVFCQEETSRKQAEIFAEEIRGKVQILKPLSKNYITNLKEMANLIAKAIS